MKNFFLNHKNEIKYKDVEFESIVWKHIDGKNEKSIEKHTYTITGVGKKAVKYQKDHGEDQFIFYNDRDFDHIAQIIIKSFENEFWNENVRKAIADQKKYCQDNHDPLFAPEDGFCWSCGHQIYATVHGSYGYADRAANELITGCPHCHRSYCD